MQYLKEGRERVEGFQKSYKDKRSSSTLLNVGRHGKVQASNERAPPIEVRPLNKVQDPHKWAAPPKKGGDPLAPYQPVFAGTPGAVPGQVVYAPGQPGTVPAVPGAVPGQPVYPQTYQHPYTQPQVFAQPGQPPAYPQAAYPAQAQPPVQPQAHYAQAPGQVPGKVPGQTPYGQVPGQVPGQTPYGQVPGQAPYTQAQAPYTQTPLATPYGQVPPTATASSATPEPEENVNAATGEPRPPKRPVVDPRTFAPPPPSRREDLPEPRSHISRRREPTAVAAPAASPAPVPPSRPLPPARSASAASSIPSPLPSRPVPSPGSAPHPPPYQVDTPPASTESLRAAKPAKPKPKPKPSQASGMPDLGALQARMASMGLEPQAVQAGSQAVPVPGAQPVQSPAPAKPKPAKPKPKPSFAKPAAAAAPTAAPAVAPSQPSLAPAPSTPSPSESLDLHTLWYAQPMDQLQLPASLAGRSYSCSGSANSSRQNLTLAVRQPDLRVLRLELEWPVGAPQQVDVKRHLGFPPRPLAQAELAALPYGEAVAAWAAQQTGRRVGDGECWTLAKQALEAAGAMPSQGYVHGAEVLVQEGGQVARSFDMMRRGDIAQFTSAQFATGYTGPNHTAIITHVDHSRLSVLEQNVAGSPVQPGSYDLATMHAGTLVIFRPAAPDWIEPL